MGMVCQQGKSENPVAIALDSFLKEKIKSATVLVVEKDVLTSIPPKDDVVHRARIMDPWFTCHGIKIASFGELANLQA
jgi:hypothetical protein